VGKIDGLGTDSPLRLSATLTGADLQFTWLSRATNFIFEAATQFASPDWADLYPQPVIQRGGVTNTTSAVIGAAARFFRLRVGP